MTEVINKLETVRAELELEVCEAELDLIRRQRRMAESSSFGAYRESGSLFGDQNGYLYDEPRWPGFNDPRIYGGWTARLEDRQEGRNEPFYRDESQLAQIRGDGRMLAGENEVGVGVVRVIKNFTVGTGYTYSFAPKEESDQDLADEIQEWNDEFDMRVRWDEAERECLSRAIEDGEVFVEMENIGGGRADIEFVEPDAIVQPRDAPTITEYVGGAFAYDWTMGVATQIRRPTKVFGYFRDLTGDQRDWSWVPASRMMHWKRNVVRNIKRGISDFYAVAQELRRADKILRNTGEGAALQSAIAWVREHPPGTTASQVISMSSSKTEIEVDRTTPSGNSRTNKFQRYLPGTILDVRAGQQYKPGPMGNGAQYVDVSTSILRYAAIRWNMPDWLISSDSSTSNFASVLVTESPFTKSIEVEQKQAKSFYEACKMKILDMACQAGRFRSRGVSTVEELRSRVTMNVIMPRVTTRNKLEETKINSVLHQSHILSKQSWSAKEELDYKHEKAQLEEDPPEILGGDVLRSSGLDVGLDGGKDLQPQANEPGNKNQLGSRNNRSK